LDTREKALEPTLMELTLGAAVPYFSTNDTHMGMDQFEKLKMPVNKTNKSANGSYLVVLLPRLLRVASENCNQLKMTSRQLLDIPFDILPKMSF
jgi:hypothetical protein